MFLFIIKFKRHKRNETSKVEWVAKTDQRYLGKTSALQGLKTAISRLKKLPFSTLWKMKYFSGYIIQTLMVIVCSKANHYSGASRKPDVPCEVVVGHKHHEASICLLTNSWAEFRLGWLCRFCPLWRNCMCLIMGYAENMYSELETFNCS